MRNKASVKDTLGRLTVVGVAVFLGIIALVISGCGDPVALSMLDPVVDEGGEVKPPEVAVPDILNLRVDSIEYGKDGYVASLTQQDSGVQYEMLVSIPNLEDRYVDLSVGDVVNVVVDYIAEKDPPIISPIGIHV